MHRFWIEAGELVYEKKLDENRATIMYRLGEIPMSVKKHRLKYNEKGEIVDDENDSSDDSVEARFAQYFTQNYREIGHYFPELLRLEELTKLSFLVSILESEYSHYKEQQTSYEFNSKQTEQNLSKLRSTIQYKMGANQAYVENQLSQTIADNGYTPDQVSNQEKQRVRNEIIRNLNEQDNRLKQSVIEQLQTSYQIYSNSISSYVVKYLEFSDCNSLATFIARELTMRQKDKYARICKSIESLGIKQYKTIEKERDFPNHKDECVWVPAAFRSYNNWKIYGGV